MPFIPPMICTRVTDQRLLANARYFAGPRLDGQDWRTFLVAPLSPVVGLDAHCSAL